MKKALMTALALAALILMTAVPTHAADKKYNAVYLGVKGYGDSSVNVNTKPDFEYNFFVNGDVHTYTMDNGEKSDDSVWTYDIQNELQEGYLYRITVSGDKVMAAEPLDDADNLVKGIIGKVGTKTINISSTVYKMTSECRTFRITWTAGGTKVEEDLPTSGRTVRAILDSNGKISAMYLSPIPMNRLYPVKGKAGRRTLKNFLATALMPVGTTLYVFGGGWNWQDTGASRLLSTIGVPESWIDFFQAQTINYTFKSQDYADGDDPKNMDPKHSYYPYYGWNEYYYAGVDCSSYIAWTVYNTLQNKAGKSTYLRNSRNMAKNFANRKWGTWTNEVNKPTNAKDSDFHAGDVFSIDGHVWICVGTCSDGSLVILHSTPSLSYTNLPGGGPQIGAIGDSDDCEAYKLADYYMTTYYPEWSRRYPTTLKDYDTMTNVTAENTGKFSWDLGEDGVLSDPDGYADMTVEELLKNLFGEK